MASPEEGGFPNPPPPDDDEEQPSIEVSASGRATFETFVRKPSHRQSYSQRARNWGEIQQRQPDEGVAQSLAPPSRKTSNYSSRMIRMDSLVAVRPQKEEVDEDDMEKIFPVSDIQTGGGERADDAFHDEELGDAAPPVRRLPPGAPSSRRPAREASSIRRSSRRVGGASTIQGRKTVRLSVMPISEDSEEPMNARVATAGKMQSFAPKRLLDIENGTSIVVSDERFLNQQRYNEIDQDGAIVVSAKGTVPIAQEDALFFSEQGPSLQDKIQSGDIRGLEVSNEVGILGGAWRGILRRLMMRSLDDISALQLSRQIQLWLPFQTGYESYIIGQIIEALDCGRKSDVQYILSIAFKNRNVSRIIVQNIGARWDFLWHWYSQVTSHRRYDAWGQFPFVGITAFPATENFPTSRNHALASIFRRVLGPGAWLTRVFTRGREGLVTDNPNNTAQNLAAESNGFELANRNQYGNYFGRLKTNEFRKNHRLPTDESLVRTFVAQPGPTMVNNGVVHTLRQLAKHWHNMLSQPSGNFAHQRMEQLDPFETMRFHMPNVMVVLASLRGRNSWDTLTLGPFIQRCQNLKPALNADECRHLARTMKEEIAVNLCGGIASVIDPLTSWLDAILLACDGIEAEAKEVYQEVTAVEIGIRLGHDLITQVSWKIPSDKDLKTSILNHIKGHKPGEQAVSERRVQSAMLLTTPRDKRTLIELVKNNLVNSKPAQLLLGRVKTLLQRDLRRDNLNEAIRELAMGEDVEVPLHDEWYWVVEGEKKAVYVYDNKVTGKDSHRFVHVDSGQERFVSLKDGFAKIQAYIPVAEAITRAQRCFMNIELDHGKKFKLDAFMEFSFLRTALRRLTVLSQVACEELDNARLNVLREVQRSSQLQVAVQDLVPGKTYYRYNPTTKEYEKFVCEKKYQKEDKGWKTLARSKIVTIPPQSIIVIGGGPTGLMTVVHCTENVLVSGGEMKLYEARDAFSKGGATFERAQIVRLDARWIAMLRYHLGTGFEDVYIPASGETDSQLGNTLPSQGFVEITIKDLENMLHVEISRLWSKGVIQCFTDSKAKYDADTNSLTKYGDALKIGDLILRSFDPNGVPSKKHFSWRVADLTFTQPLGLDDLRVGAEYGVYIRLKNAVLPFKLTGVNLESRTYTFKSIREGIEDLKATAHSLPSVYRKGTTHHAQVNKVIVECVRKGSSGGYVRNELPMAVIQKEKFTLDIGHTHVIECIGKPHGSKEHFSATTHEPYGVCCCQGLKVSMLMHNFGEKRWGQGIVDDIRSINDQNTRIVGDFTKMVRQAPIAQLMRDKMKGKNWQAHFGELVKDYPELCETEHNIIPKLDAAMRDHALRAPFFRRKTLQTRFFETGDNFYLGMEFTREYDKWKNELGDNLVAPLRLRWEEGEKRKDIDKLKGILMHHVDRLWYEACLEVIRTGDVYNPGAAKRVPQLFMINSYTEQKLGSLPLGESFRLAERPDERYEILSKGRKQIIVRNVEGFISKLPNKTMVKREGNLTRSPDGNQESRVALATFPVAHYVNFRTARLNNETRGYVFAFVGDEQATPHFMRYSGLTGACINAMLFNNFVKQALEGVSFQDRFALYSKETNWSNGEVVQRGTGSNYGQDGFLRPGFSYDHGLDFLHSKVIEYMETGQDLNQILSSDWKAKFAASMIPRGMELIENFVTALYEQTQTYIFNKFIKEVEADESIDGKPLVATLKERRDKLSSKRGVMDYEAYWDEFLDGLPAMEEPKARRLAGYHVEIAKRLEQIVSQVVEFATKAHLYNERVSSELVNQPKPVDSIVDNFAVEAQNFANSLTMSSAFSAAALAFVLVDIHGDAPTSLGRLFGAIVGGLNIAISFGTMTNVSRYKIRNEEARVSIFEEKLPRVRKTVFSLMDHNSQEGVTPTINPFAVDLQKRVDKFLKDVEYYDTDEQTEFKNSYEALKINDPDSVAEFRNRITTYFLPELYQVNSYIQESLVDIVRVLEDRHYLLTQKVDKPKGGSNAKLLFNRLTAFTPQLEKSLQRGPVNFGFLLQRSVFYWDCSLVFKYFYSLLCFTGARRKNPLAPIQTETLGILRQTRALSSEHNNEVLRREIRDLEQLYWATRESEIASMIFCSGFLVFIASIIFSVSRIITRAGGGGMLTDVAFWATAASATGATLALFHLVRKFFILVRLWCILGGKARSSADTDSLEAIRRTKRVTFTQILLTMSRMVAAGAAAVALPWAIAQFGFGDSINTDEALPFWIALGAISAAIGSTIFFFIVEYVVRYRLSPKLGEFICEAFREEIEEMYKILAVPINDIDSKQLQERETWEYVAREFLHKYRFDTVFAADRFGSILQYIQSGMEQRQ